MPSPRRLALLCLPLFLIVLATLSTRSALPPDSDDGFWDRNRRALTQLAAVAALGAAVLMLGNTESKRHLSQRE